MKKLYSPNQILLGTLLGGAFAAIYFLTENFDVLGKDNLSKKVLTVGLTLTLGLLIALLFLPENTPSILIAIFILFPTLALTRKHSPTKQQIIDSEEYVFQSWWKTLGMTVAWFAAFMVSFFILVILAGLSGIVELA
ncbi:MAG: hypothetical protein R3332_10455 [Pseudohongiellaceae bacterium]|nr:hypothetical protein [Pseudohongiellaceae bacterium]